MLTEFFFCCRMTGEVWRPEGVVTVLGLSGDGGLSPWARPLAALPRMAKA